MTGKSFSTLGLVTIYTVVLTLLLLGVDRALQGGSGRSVQLTDGLQCIASGSLLPTFDTCAEQSLATAVALPVSVGGVAVEKPAYVHYRFVADIPTDLGGRPGIHFSHPTDLVRASVNGEVLAVLPSFSGEPRTRWSKPTILPWPDGVLLPGANTIDLVVAVTPSADTVLTSFSVGNSDSLLQEQRLRAWITTTLSQSSFVLMMIMALSFAVLRSAHGGGVFNWLIVAAVSGVLYTAGFAVTNPPLPETAWLKVGDIALRVYGFACAIFFLRLVDVRHRLFERSYAAYLVFSIIVVAAASSDHYKSLSDITNFGLIIPAVVFMALFWMNRHGLGVVSNQMLLFVFSLIVATGPATYWSSGDNSVSLLIQQMVPMLMVGIGFWIILGQVVSSVNAYKQINATLETRIQEKSAELSATYAKLAETRRVEAVSKERERIMMDLHDGVGGQLVNAITYLRSGSADHSVLQSTLEECLSDLSLAVDSLAETDNVATLLGMLRARLEPLLTANGLKFRWQIDDDPDMPDIGPSRNINLLRIVQEAITNVIKHADATEISIRADKHSISICDNGRGLDAARRQDQRTGGQGMSTMARRAALLRAELTVDETEQGTCVALSWNSQTAVQRSSERPERASTPMDLACSIDGSMD
ncbi:MAG: ATP-binding protein [Pseudomonadota bacterium]